MVGVKPYLSVIIPAYNEAERLPLTLVDIDRHLSAKTYAYEIIVVDDGSSDHTVEVANKFTKLIPNLRVIGYKDNQGKGNAVKLGMLEARGKYRLFTDSDNSTSIDHFDKMIPEIKEGYDIVICSRDVNGSQMHPPQSLIKRILGNMGNLFIQALLLPGIRDTQCGFKAFSEEAASRIFSLQKISRWGFDIEALALGKRMGYKIKEIPVYWVNDADSRVKPLAYFQVLFETVKIRWWLWRKAYNLGAN
ncbi:MAG: glycosyltransferase family 2 protein [Candidatus Colwellbacteria bacterium]|nr:glycosyltransferase family 2 protein [Candidatus Colwellbacteria bacterium]